VEVQILQPEAQTLVLARKVEQVEEFLDMPQQIMVVE